MISEPQTWRTTSAITRAGSDSRAATDINMRGGTYENRGSHYNAREDSRRRPSHSDRIIRRHPGGNWSSRHGGSRGVAGPYDRKPEKTWRAKERSLEEDSLEWRQGQGRGGEKTRDIVPYEHVPASSVTDGRCDASKENSATGRKLASAIITPSSMDHSMEENVTIRDRGEARTLTFSPTTNKEVLNPDEQVIGALDDMDIGEHLDSTMMEAEVEDDDLLGVDLMDLKA
ncbi:zf-CCHC_4 domain-containing protein [Raphanus sativus]|nr:zf-CCHC_4 domain-containing protein [Raphanus sativus]